MNKPNWKKIFYIAKDNNSFLINTITWEHTECVIIQSYVLSFSKIKSQTSIQNISKKGWRLYSKPTRTLNTLLLRFQIKNFYPEMEI